MEKQVSQSKVFKTLLIFAHRGEASAFLEEMSFKAIQGLPKDVSAYEGEKAFVLITGEGGQQALFATATFLAHQMSSKHKKTSIDRVIQFGVAGTFDQGLNPGSIRSIRCAYAEKKAHSEKSITEPEFKSFPLSRDQGMPDLKPPNPTALDCISAVDRVFSKDLSQKLSAFAPLVDRELWYVAYACHCYDLACSSFKYISDYADENTQCLEIGSKAKVISYELFRVWLSLHRQKIADVALREQDYYKDEILESLSGEGFYWTTSQTQSFRKLLEAFQRKIELENKDVLTFLPIQDIKSKEKHPKKRSQKLLDFMNGAVFPEKTRIRRILRKAVEPYRNQNLRIEFDPELERKSLDISFQAKSKEEALKHLKSLQGLPFERIKKIFDGESFEDERRP